MDNGEKLCIASGWAAKSEIASRSLFFKRIPNIAVSNGHKSVIKWMFMDKILPKTLRCKESYHAVFHIAIVFLYIHYQFLFTEQHVRQLILIP